VDDFSEDGKQNNRRIIIFFFGGRRRWEGAGWAISKKNYSPQQKLLEKNVQGKTWENNQANAFSNKVQCLTLDSFFT